MNHTHPTYPPRRVQGKLLATSYHSVFVSACTTHHATGEPGEQNSENGKETGEEIVLGELYRVCRGVGNILLGISVEEAQAIVSGISAR